MGTTYKKRRRHEKNRTVEAEAIPTRCSLIEQEHDELFKLPKNV